MSNNKGGNSFKFRNIQVVRRPNSGRQTQQNTQINMQETAEDQFADIQAAARAEALLDLNDILSDDDSVDYSPPQEPLEPQIQVQNPNPHTSDSENTSVSNPETVTDSLIDSSSIEVLQPNTGLEIQLPINPPLRQPPSVPESPRTNVAVPNDDSLVTEDEDTGDQVVPLVVGAQTAEQGR